MILVLGGAGFIGRHVRARIQGPLLSVDVQRMTAREGERTYRCDLGDPAALARLWEALGDALAAVDGVIHLAAHYDFTNRDDARYRRLQATLPELCRRIAGDVPEHAPVVYASSMAGLAPTRPGVPLGPAAPRLEAWTYPRWKRAAEETLERELAGRPVVELVLAGVYSDHGELVPLFQQIERIRRRSVEAMLYPGPRRRGLTYVHVDDAADAFARAVAAYRGVPGVHRLLVGEPEPVTYAEIHDRASVALHGRRLPLVRVPRWLAWVGAVVLGAMSRWRGRRRFLAPWMIRFAGEHYELDVEATARALGWRPAHRLGEELDGILALAAEHPDRWLAVHEARPW